jgi:hypothetical protein
MPNSELQHKSFSISPEQIKFLGSSSTYEALKMKQSRLEDNKTKNPEEFNKMGGEKTLSYVKKILNQERETIYNPKKIAMDTGLKNQFKKEHEKDRDNANPTAVGGIPKMGKGDLNDKILNNKEVYNENLNKNSNKIKYLIEYLTKTTKKL